MTHIFQQTADFHENIADKDNPLIDRFSQDEWLALRKQSAQSSKNTALFTASLFEPTKQVISFAKYSIADFSEISMQEEPEESFAPAETFVENLPQNPETLLPIQPVQSLTEPTPQTVVVQPEIKKAKTQTLSKADQRKLAKQQQQRIAEQQAEKQAEAERLRQEKIAQALANPNIHEKLLNQRKSMIDNKESVKDIFSELEQNLQIMQLPETLSLTAKQAYQQATAILQNPQNAQNSEQIQKSLYIVDKLAKANISDAMLYQVLFYLRGRDDLGIGKDVQKGLQLLELSAKLQDNRAEKLLSKLYFSGEIVPQDTEKARYWLEQSAMHGHKEAQKLEQGLITAHMLQQNRVEDVDYFKKLGLGVGITLLIVFAIIFVFKI